MSIFRSIRQRWRNKPGILPWLTSWPARATALGLSGLPATWASRLGAWIGAIIWWIPRRRKLGIENYSQANPQATEAEVTAVVQESCRSMGRMGVEMMVVLEKYRGQLLSRIEFEPGAQELFESLRGQGALFLQAHLGGFEVFGATLGQLQMNPGFTMRLPTNVYVAQRLVQSREGWGCSLFHRHGAVRKMLMHLKEGHCVVMASDQNAHKNPIFVPWFGKLAATERAAASLALRTGAPVVGVWCYRKPCGTRWSIGGQMIRPASASAKATEESVGELTLAIHQTLEEAILKAPGQYLWVHNRYRVRPLKES
ncbi:MAG: hypothetical protein OTJ44_08200 [Planctomycetota bacterium]|nr:hypothetical protein [Planctomycetota bacterium]